MGHTGKQKRHRSLSTSTALWHVDCHRKGSIEETKSTPPEARELIGGCLHAVQAKGDKADLGLHTGSQHCLEAGQHGNRYHPCLQPSCNHTLLPDVLSLTTLADPSWARIACGKT